MLRTLPRQPVDAMRTAPYYAPEDAAMCAQCFFTRRAYARANMIRRDSTTICQDYRHACAAERADDVMRVIVYYRDGARLRY